RDDFGLKIGKLSHRTSIKDGLGRHIGSCGPLNRNFLRRTSLDELPQFFNVLLGGMSIVGPRPHAVAHNEQYRILIDGYMLRHKVKPGITGWAQINGWRGETDTLEKMQKRVEYDLEYIREWSVWLDLKIIFLTVFKGFISKTAY
ncbi:sugar transferase, partial [Klebsiella quasipneumoniae]|uniref:sugar transferase n=1 Tax=Klebsiella quasipneumoniae TaxID=1463165 RepID=UPI0038CFC5AB